jgi:integrator complex subunit 9
MTSDRQDLLYIPLSPLPHGELMRSGALQTIHSIEASSFTHKAIREPCIVFTGDPTSASKGMLPWFIQYWGNAENACIFIGNTIHLLI